MASLHLELLAARLKRAKQNFACCFFDKEKAYQSTNLEGVVESSCNRFKYKDLAVMVTVRHSKILFVVQDKYKNRYMVQAGQGIITGDAYGPMAFVLHSHDWLENLWAIQTDNARFHESAKFPKVVRITLDEERGLPPQTQWVPIGDIIYADDQAQFLVFQTQEELSSALDLMRISLEEYGGKLNYGKSEIQVHLVGKGSQKWAKKLRTEGCTDGEGHTYPVVSHSKHLGSMISINGSVEQEITFRLSRARVALGRLGHRVLFKQKIKKSVRVSIYKAVIQSILLYNLHIRVIPEWLMMKLEQFQMKCLRGIEGEGRHISRKTNTTLREEMQVPSVQSLLTQRRLRFWQQIFTQHKAGAGVRAAALGTIDIIEDQNWQPQQLTLLKENLRPIAQITNAWLDPRHTLTTNDVEVLCSFSRSSIDSVLSYDTSAENNKRKLQERVENAIAANAATIICEECGQPKLASKISTHMQRTHYKVKFWQTLIKDDTCPGCNVKFTHSGVHKHMLNNVCRRARPTVEAAWTTYKQQVQAGLTSTIGSNQLQISTPSTHQPAPPDTASPWEYYVSVKKGKRCNVRGTPQA